MELSSEFFNFNSLSNSFTFEPISFSLTIFSHKITSALLKIFSKLFFSSFNFSKSFSRFSFLRLNSSILSFKVLNSSSKDFNLSSLTSPTSSMEIFNSSIFLFSYSKVASIFENSKISSFNFSSLLSNKVVFSFDSSKLIFSTLLSSWWVDPQTGQHSPSTKFSLSLWANSSTLTLFIYSLSSLTSFSNNNFWFSKALSFSSKLFLLFKDSSKEFFISLYLLIFSLYSPSFICFSKIELLSPGVSFKRLSSLSLVLPKLSILTFKSFSDFSLSSVRFFIYFFNSTSSLFISLNCLSKPS